MADTVEQLQQAYLNAINAGDDAGVTKARDAIESFITAEEAKVASPTPATNTPPEAQPPVETGVPTEAVSQEQPSGSGEQTGEAQAEPAKSTDGAPAPNQTNSEWLDSLAPEVRKQVELLLDDNRKLHHRIKADDDRVAAYQSRYHELQKKAVQLEEDRKRLLSATAQPQGNPAAKPKTAPARSLADDPELSRVAQTDEELAKLLWSQKLEQEQKFERLENLLNERLAPINKGFEQQQINSELHRLQQIVPNAVEIFNYRSPEGVNVWDDWVNRQPKGVQTLALSDNADDVARAMELYGRDIERLYYTQQPAAQVTQPVAGTQPVDAKVAGVQAERERKLQAQPVGSASVRPPQNAEPTMEEIMRNPELLRAAQEKILKEELRKRQAEI